MTRVSQPSLPLYHLQISIYDHTELQGVPLIWKRRLRKYLYLQLRNGTVFDRISQQIFLYVQNRYAQFSHFCLNDTTPDHSRTRGRQKEMSAPLPSPRVLNIADRGTRSLAPENTLAAARKGLEVGADMWELDIRMTADG